MFLEIIDELMLALKKYISPEERKQIINKLTLVQQYNKYNSIIIMEYQKIANLLND